MTLLQHKHVRGSGDSHKLCAAAANPSPQFLGNVAFPLTSASPGLCNQITGPVRLHFPGCSWLRAISGPPFLPKPNMAAVHRRRRTLRCQKVFKHPEENKSPKHEGGINSVCGFCPSPRPLPPPPPPVFHFCSSCGVLKVSYTLAANSFTWSIISKSCTKWLGVSLQTVLI